MLMRNDLLSSERDFPLTSMGTGSLPAGASAAGHKTASEKKFVRFHLRGNQPLKSQPSRLHRQDDRKLTLGAISYLSISIQDGSQQRQVGF